MRAAVDGLAAAAKAHEDATGVEALRLLEQPAPALAHLRGAVRPAVLPVLAAHDARLAAARAAPARRFMNEAGVRDEEERLLRERDAAVDAASAPLIGSLAAMESRLAEE